MEKNIMLQAELEELQRKLKEKPLEYQARKEEINRSMDSLEILMAEKDLDHKFLSRQSARLEDQLKKDMENIDRVDSYRKAKESQVIFLRREIEAESLLSREILKRKVISEKESTSREGELESLRGEVKSLKAIDLNMRAMSQKIMERYSTRISEWDLLLGNMNIARMPQEDILREVEGAIRERISHLEEEASESKISLRVISSRSQSAAEKISRLVERLKKEQRELQGCLAEGEELKRSMEKSETRLKAVRSFQERIDRLNASQAILEKEYQEWLDLEKPLLEARTVEIKSILGHSVQTPEETKKPVLEDKKGKPQRNVVTELMPRIEERLEKQVREKFDDLDKQHKELEIKLQEEEVHLKREMSEKLKLEEENKRAALNKKIEEEEKSLKETLQAKLSTEEERLRMELAEFNQIVQKKKEAFQEKIMAWGREQKSSMEKRLKLEEENKRRELRETLEKEKQQMLERLKQSVAQVASGKKEEVKTGTLPTKPQVVELNRKPEPGQFQGENKPGKTEEIGKDTYGNIMVPLAEQGIEVKFKGIIETGLLDALSPNAMNVFFNKAESIQTGQTLPRALFSLPDGEAISGPAKVLEITPNRNAKHPFKFLLKLELSNLSDGHMSSIKKCLENVMKQHLKDDNIQVNSL